ncbi:MAG: hypothetical protein ACRD1H_19505, partial [Vicinamibacterales bacterium]
DVHRHMASQRPEDLMRSFDDEYNAYPTPTPNAASTAMPTGVRKNEPDWSSDDPEVGDCGCRSAARATWPRFGCCRR